MDLLKIRQRAKEAKALEAMKAKEAAKASARTPTPTPMRTPTPTPARVKMPSPSDTGSGRSRDVKSDFDGSATSRPRGGMLEPKRGSSASIPVKKPLDVEKRKKPQREESPLPFEYEEGREVSHGASSTLSPSVSVAAPAATATPRAPEAPLVEAQGTTEGPWSKSIDLPLESFTKEAQEARTRNSDPLAEFLVRYDENEDDVAGAALVPEVESDVYRRYLAFELDAEEYAISIMDVREILAVVSVTPIPRAPAFILGVFSKRGVVMPILDLAAVLRLRSPKQKMERGSRVLVVGNGDRVCGLRVDALKDAVRLREEDIEPVPSGLESRAALLLDGLGRSQDRMLILLDGAALLDALATATSAERIHQSTWEVG